MTLGSTQTLVKMSTRDVPGGKGGRCVRLTTYHHIVPVNKSRSLNSPRHLWACTACNGRALTFSNVFPCPMSLAEVFSECSCACLIYRTFKQLLMKLKLEDRQKLFVQWTEVWFCRPSKIYMCINMQLISNLKSLKRFFLHSVYAYNVYT
jgi:hypothetical protein